jgi:hypothetical protein
MATRAKELAMKEAIIDMKIAILDMEGSLRKLSLSLHSFERELYGKRSNNKSKLRERIFAHSKRGKPQASREEVRDQLPSSVQSSKVVDGDRTDNK